MLLQSVQSNGKETSGKKFSTFKSNSYGVSLLLDSAQGELQRQRTEISEHFFAESSTGKTSACRAFVEKVMPKCITPATDGFGANRVV